VSNLKSAPWCAVVIAAAVVHFSASQEPSKGAEDLGAVTRAGRETHFSLHVPNGILSVV